MGTRVRIVLNRYEAREAARSAQENALLHAGMSPASRVRAEAALALPKGQLAVFLGRHRGHGTIGVTQKELEKHSKLAAAEAGTHVPEDATFVVGTDSDGQISGATFQWWQLEDSEG